MMTRSLLGVAVLGAVLLSSAVLTVSVAAEKDEAAKPMCPVSGKPAMMSNAVDYKKGEVYFCCANCPKEFAAHTDKYAAKANHQLVVTDQYEQVNCPISGSPISKDHHAMVADTQVYFCCPKCEAKVKAADKKGKMELVFADKPFDKAYQPKEEETK